MQPPKPEYLPLSFNIEPNTPPGAATTFLITPNIPDQRLEICGVATYNGPGECEILRLSRQGHWDDNNALNVGFMDAVAYNPIYPDADAVQDDDAPRFCRAPWGLLAHDRPLAVTFSGTKPLRGTLYCLRVLAGKALIDGADQWKHDVDFMRFVERAFGSMPPPAAIELMYHGWLGRARTGI